MKRIAIQAYNNTDWLTDTDFIILDLTKDEIKEIKDINKSLNTIFLIIMQKYIYTIKIMKYIVKIH